MACGLADHRVSRPEHDAFRVRVPIQLDARPALVLAERVPHGGDGRHGRLGGPELRVDRHDAPVSVGHVALGLRLALVLLLELFARVEDEIEEFRTRSLETFEPPPEHGELLRPARLVPGTQQVLVLGRDARHARLGRRVVPEEQVLAERRVAVREHSSLRDRAVRELDELRLRQPENFRSLEAGGEVPARKLRDLDPHRYPSLLSLRSIRIRIIQVSA